MNLPEVFLKKCFPSKETPNSHIDEIKISHLEKIFESWYQRQFFIDQALKNKEGLTLNQLGDLNPHPRVQKWLNTYNTVGIYTWNQGIGRMTYNTSGRISLLPLNYEKLTVANSLYTVIDTFTHPYKSGELKDVRLLENQSQEIYNLLRIVGVEMGFFDSRYKDTGVITFMEGNTFSSRKQNDEYFDFYEIYEALSVRLGIWSLSDDIYESLPQKYFIQNHEGLKDNLNLPPIDPDLFLHFLDDNFSQLFSHFYFINQFWESANEERRKRFIHNLMKSMRVTLNRTRPVDGPDIRGLIGVLYYLESVFYNFDSNHDGFFGGRRNSISGTGFTAPLSVPYSKIKTKLRNSF